MGATLATVLPMLREHYHDAITEIFYTSDKAINPILASMESKSMDDGLGRGYIVSVEYGMGASVGADFSVAQGISQGAVAGNSALRDRWIVQATTINATAQWTRDSMLAAQGKGADELFDVMQREMDSKILKVRQRLALCAVEQGWGRVATASAVANPTFTCSTSSCNRFNIGDRLVGCDTIASNNFLTLAGVPTVRVISIDPDTGVVGTSLDPSAGGAQAWTGTTVVFNAGDREDSDTPTQMVPAGLAGWIPSTAPTGAWMNITRTGIPELCGHRIDATGLDHAQAIIRATNRLLKYGSKADVCYMSPEDYAILCADKDATKVVAVELGKFKIGFDGVSVGTAAGNVPVVPDAMLEQGTAYIGPFGDKKFAPFMAHNNDLVNIDNIDGLDIRALAASTAFEMRLYFRGAIALPAPGKFAVINTLPSS